MALHDKTLYPDDETKREKVYNKYKHHLEKVSNNFLNVIITIIIMFIFQYDREFTEWYGYTIPEAEKKYKLSLPKIINEPLKINYRMQLIEKLREEKFISEKNEA